MGNSRNNGWQRSAVQYSEEQISGVLDKLGIEVVSETESHFLCLCPFHANTDSPAFEVDKESGLSLCFNPACDSRHNLESLVRQVASVGHFEAKRLILDSGRRLTLEEKLDRVKEPFEFIYRDESEVEYLRKNFWNNRKPQLYMKGRNFHKETMEYFNIGYSTNLDAIVVPFYDDAGKPIGYIRRKIDEKKFINSKGLQKNHTVWNLHNAKRYDSIILTDASFDAMSIHQAGYPNVGSLIGGNISEYQVDLIRRYFDKVILMVDDDDPEFRDECRRCEREGSEQCVGHRAGIQLGLTIAQHFPRVYWTCYSHHSRFPTEPLEGYRTGRAKDATDMNEDEIRYAIRNSISHFEFLSWQGM